MQCHDCPFNVAGVCYMLSDVVFLRDLEFVTVPCPGFSIYDLIDMQNKGKTSSLKEQHLRYFTPREVRRFDLVFNHHLVFDL